MAKKISIETFQKIVFERFMYNESFQQLSMETGLAADTVGAMCGAFELLRDGRTGELVHKMRRSHYSDSIIRLAAEALKKDIPEDVAQAMAKRREMAMFKVKAKQERGQEPAEEPVEEPVEEAPPSQLPAALPLAEEAKNGNDALYFIRILEELHELVQLQRDLLDVVIPKWAGDLKDNQNANSDVLAGLLKEQGQALDAIRCNTRKRGL